jgi:hypothetical protein
MSKKLDTGAIGSCTNKTEGLFGIGGDGMVDEIPIKLEIAQKGSKKIAVMSGCCTNKNKSSFWYRR